MPFPADFVKSPVFTARIYFNMFNKWLKLHARLLCLSLPLNSFHCFYEWFGYHDLKLYFAVK
jgi:hypothetical protein